MSASRSTGLKRALDDESSEITTSHVKRFKLTPSPSSVLQPSDLEPYTPDVTSDNLIRNLIEDPLGKQDIEGAGRSTREKHKDNATHEKSRKRKEKEGKKAGRRRRGTRNDEVGRGEESADHPKVPRLPKRQCALLIGFCGSGYSGMQIQPDHSKTIEGVLFHAMVRAGAVSQDNADNPVKIGLARAARTDAGVHAAGNLVSLKMITSVPDVPDLVARINQELPPEIRLWGYVRVQNSFNARLVCDSRKYTYFFPTYLLLPPKPGSGLDRVLRRHAATLSPDPQISTGDSSGALFWERIGNLPPDEEVMRKRAWRVPSELMQKLRQTARKYEGTHTFHNFTVARDFKDPSNQRHMKKIEIADPIVHGETEWISVLFHGQSFMLHQRKMMSGLVLSCRTNTPEQLIEELYGQQMVFIPKMPSLGLLLEEPLFDSYNIRMATVNAKLEPSSPDYRPLISFEAHREAINAFKQKYIYDNMRNIEDGHGLFDAWIRSVDAYGGNDLLYLNPKGTVPIAAIIKQGERRENPFREKRRFDATSFSTDDNSTKLLIEEDEEEIVVSKEDLADS